MKKTLIAFGLIISVPVFALTGKGVERESVNAKMTILDKCSSRRYSTVKAINSCRLKGRVRARNQRRVQRNRIGAPRARKYSDGRKTRNNHKRPVRTFSPRKYRKTTSQRYLSNFNIRRR